jgi:hypothetical protein
MRDEPPKLEVLPEYPGEDPLFRLSPEARAPYSRGMAFMNSSGSLVQKVPIGLGRETQLRFDAINFFDNQYQIRNGQGVGVFASQFGQPKRSC